MEALDAVRKLCMEQPGVEERLSHGEPSWFHLKGRQFASYANQHHDDRVAVWLAAPPGVQQMLIAEDSETYFRPPYVGVSGWVGVYLDRAIPEALPDLIEEAWKHTQRRARKRQDN